ncbi:YtpI family protein [Evansella sp. AB-P1]|uniref:YtpI family protein n=1 Tax=Evansella sp. AB-P1 TaxID=3037653 RepID=UPI00241F8C48|nr:YtpI family protein [Evansella sp. AB-P1]MDG5786991.1 YtpI family protein [Evansella sp. AB-P1]
MQYIIIIIISLVFYVYNKVQQAKAPGPAEKRWYAAKGSIAIGIFFITFGVSSYINLGTSVAAIVSLIFTVFGLLNVIFGIKFYRTFLPFAKKEVEALKEQETKEQT